MGGMPPGATRSSFGVPLFDVRCWLFMFATDTDADPDKTGWAHRRAAGRPGAYLVRSIGVGVGIGIGVVPAGAV